MFAKKFLTAITSVVLCMTMLILSPIQIVASAAGNEQNKYISEVKVGMGETSEQASKELGFPINVTGFIRWECGEGIEKKKNDFAAEVAEQMNK